MEYFQLALTIAVLIAVVNSAKKLEAIEKRMK
jgi:hypothetical protein